MSAELDPTTREFYHHVLTTLKASGVPFLVGGAYAFERYTAIERHTKDLDLFVRPGDVERIFDVFVPDGYRAERTHPHWLAKLHGDDAFVDLIYHTGNGLFEVDDDWFRHAIAEEVMGVAVDLMPVEEMLCTKSFIMERERFDGADVAHLLRARAEGLDWPRLLRRFGPHWRILLVHLLLFGFIYPGERSRVPDEAMAELLRRLDEESRIDPPQENMCQGTLLSRSQYLLDLLRWGYEDARLSPRGGMSKEDITRWTAAIAVDGSF